MKKSLEQKNSIIPTGETMEAVISDFMVMLTAPQSDSAGSPKKGDILENAGVLEVVLRCLKRNTDENVLNHSSFASLLGRICTCSAWDSTCPIHNDKFQFTISDFVFNLSTVIFDVVPTGVGQAAAAVMLRIGECKALVDKICCCNDCS